MEFSIDSTRVIPLLRELHALLVDGNVDANYGVENLRPLLKGSAYFGYLDGMARAIEEYDFDAALNILRRLGDDFNVTL